MAHAKNPRLTVTLTPTILRLMDQAVKDGKYRDRGELVFTAVRDTLWPVPVPASSLKPVEA